MEGINVALAIAIVGFFTAVVGLARDTLARQKRRLRRHKQRKEK